jgi:hypothetical protein
VGEYLEGPAEDYDMWLKLGTVGKLANIDGYCLKYMIRPDSGSRLTNREIILQTIKFIKAYRYAYPHFRLAIISGYYVLFKYYLLKPVPSGLRLALTRMNYQLRKR